MLNSTDKIIKHKREFDGEAIKCWQRDVPQHRAPEPVLDQ